MLAVIDIQERFVSEEWVNNNDSKSDFRLSENFKNHVAHEIRKAKRKKCLIAVAEYHDCGETLDWVVKTIGRYKNVHFINKNQDSAYYKLSAHIDFNNIEDVTILGVNTNACIWATICSFNDHQPNLKLRIPFFATDCWWSRPGQLKRLTEWENEGMISISF